jgi:hypothetical protein
MPFAILEACLGLSFDLSAKEIRLNRPILPDFIDDLEISGLTLGTAKVDLALRRNGQSVGVEVRRRDGDVSVVAVK